VISPDGADEDTTGVTRALWEEGRNASGGPMPGMEGGTQVRGVVNQGPDAVQAAVSRAGEAGMEVWKQHYAAAVRRMDRDLEVVQKAIAARGRDTLLVVLADHGESLGDHGELLHGDAYFESVVRIPLILRVPGLEGSPEGIDTLASQVDLLPTLLELIGAVAPAGIDGLSLVPQLRGSTLSSRHIALVEGGAVWRDRDQVRGAVIAPPWTLLVQDRGCESEGELRLDTCLYHLDSDPGQTRNLAREEAQVTRRLLDHWQNFRRARESTSQATSLNLDPDFVRELQRTGYDFRPPEP
jgi:arylsulfatase A-like enzyme